MAILFSQSLLLARKAAKTLVLAHAAIYCKLEQKQNERYQKEILKKCSS